MPGWCLRDMGHRRGVIAQTLKRREDAEQGVIVWVQERADRQPRLVPRLGVEALQQRDRLIGRERVLHRPGVVLAQSVRLGPHPLGEPPVVEQIRTDWASTTPGR